MIKFILRYTVNTIFVQIGIRKTVTARIQRQQTVCQPRTTAQTNVNATNGQLSASQNLLAVNQPDASESRRSSSVSQSTHHQK